MPPHFKLPTPLFQQVVSRTLGILETSLLQRRVDLDPLDVIDQLREYQAMCADSSPGRSLRECQAGCASCCFTVAVDVTPFEAIAVAEYLEQYLSRERCRAIRERLAGVVEKRLEMTAEQRKRTALACGLLGEDGMCQAYAARPMICSGIYSLDRAACQRAAELVQIGDPSGQIPLDTAANVATAGISGGLQRFLVNQGLDGNLYELNSAVLVAMTTPDALPRYLDGEDLFRDAICTDAHSPPRTARHPQRMSRAKAAALR